MPRMSSTRDLKASDALISKVATDQGGVVSYDQLRVAGLPQSTIAARVSRGWYIRVAPGVYAIGTATLTRRGAMFAAILSAPAGARLTGRTVLELRRVRVLGRDRIAVVVAGRWRAGPHVRVHETRRLDPADRAVRAGLPATTVARALLDLACDLDVDQLTNAMHELAFRRALNLRAIRHVIERYPTHDARPVLEEAMRRHVAGEAGTWSELERRFHAVLARSDSERPRRNVLVPVDHGEPIRVDAQYESVGLCIELDPDHHMRPRSRRADGDRDVLLEASGYPYLRCTGADVERRPEHVIEAVRTTLARLRRQRHQ